MTWNKEISRTFVWTQVAWENWTQQLAACCISTAGLCVSPPLIPHTYIRTTACDELKWKLFFFLYSNHRAVISFVTCVTSFVENVKSRGSWNILFLLYEHTTQTKNIADRSFAVSTRQWRHNAIVARSHYGSAPTMQCGFLYAPEILLAETGK